MKTSEIRTATKALVDNLLAMNTNNRAIKNRVVEKYMRDIAAGCWLLTNQGIGVSADGVLLDGQHRLEAIKRSGYPPVELLIVWGLDEQVRLLVDQHAKRTARDVLQFAFDKRVSHTAPAVAACLLHSTSKLGWAGGHSMNELYDAIVEYGSEIEAVVAMPSSATFFAAPYLAAFVAALHAGQCTREQLEAFIRDVESGELLTKQDPQFHLRNLIVCSKGNVGGSQVRKERFDKATKALAAYVSGQKMGVLRV